MTISPPDAARRALEAAATTLERRHAGEDGVAEVIARLNQHDLSKKNPAREARPQRQPACRHLPGALFSANRHYRDLVPIVGEFAAVATWQKALNRRVPDTPPGMMSDYAICQMIGPGGTLPADDFAMGLFIIGPGQFYPPHWHDAPELYWLMSEPSQWLIGDGDWHDRRAGATIWNQPRVPHAIRVLTRPFFCLWAWTYDIGANYAFVGCEPARVDGATDTKA